MPGWRGSGISRSTRPRPGPRRLASAWPRLLRRLPRIDRPAVARRAIDVALVGWVVEFFHVVKGLVDRHVHGGHLARDALGPLVVAGEVGLHVTVRAGHAEGLRVALVHDVDELRRRNVLQPLDADVHEDLLRRLVLVPGDRLQDLRRELVVDLLNGRLLRRRGGSFGYARSEERRVGRERRSWSWRCLYER